MDGNGDILHFYTQKIDADFQNIFEDKSSTVSIVNVPRRCYDGPSTQLVMTITCMSDLRINVGWKSPDVGTTMSTSVLYRWTIQEM